MVSARFGRMLRPFTLLLLLFASTAHADDSRLAHVGKLWGVVRYLHPALAHSDIDWDAAFVAAVPKVKSARTIDEYAAAVQSMLDALHDPATRVKTPELNVRPPESQGKEALERTAGGVVFLRAARSGEVKDLEKEIADAKVLVLDRRCEEKEWYQAFSANRKLAPLLPAREVRSPPTRSLLHSGYIPQSGSSSGEYTSSFVTQLAQVFPAAPHAPKRVVFIVNKNAGIDALALAMQRAGLAQIVVEGHSTDNLLAGARSVDLGEGRVALVRTVEMMEDFHADGEVPVGGDARGAALALAKKPLRVRSTKPLPLPEGVRQLDRADPEMTYPSQEYRLLALVRAWNVIHWFYPYKDLLDEKWNTVLERMIPQFEAAKDADEYGLAVMELMAHVADGHTNVTSPGLLQFFGRSFAPIQLRMVDGKPVVTALLNDDAKNTGVEVGDVALAIDGEPVEERTKRLARWFTASTPDALANRLLFYALDGAAGSTLSLTVRDRAGQERVVKLPRRLPAEMRRPGREGEVVRELPGNIGYVDLERLEVAGVDAMFEQLKKTRAIVFDMRGYPRGTAWAIAPRINTKGARVAARFQRTVVSAAAGMNFDQARIEFGQPLQPTDKWKYTGKTVMLIDDRAISQSEHTGLFFEAANGTEFIGSPSAGADGDLTNFTLPGNILVSFTGQDVRHGDGRQLQRVGLQPKIEVRPTIAGIRAGRDEVLDAAIKYLSPP